MPNVKTVRPLNLIALEIREDWGRKTSPHAAPYVGAMLDLRDVTDTYGYDSGASVVRYFLANAGTWRGETARRVKAELRDMLKGA